MQEQLFSVKSGSRDVPVVLWTPDGPAGPAPLVLLGHGGSQHKTSTGVRGVAKRLADRHGCAAMAIDGPVHGDRRADDGSDAMAVFRDAVASWKDPATLDAMTADWRAALDAAGAWGEFGRVGYWGMSMGTLYGLPLVAAEPRIEVAALGLWGLTGTAPEMADPLRAAGAMVTCPILFLAQQDDQLFPLTGVIELFGLLSARDKRLHLNVGTHGEVPPEEMDGTVDFVAAHLRG